MGPYQVDIRLGDCSHTDLVIGSGEEGSKRAGERNRAVTGGTANGHSYLQQQAHTSVTLVNLNDNGCEYPKYKKGAHKLDRITMLENE